MALPHNPARESFQTIRIRKGIMFERFTDAARRTIILAQEGAQSVNHNYIGTEHLLLGLLNCDDLIAAPVLKSLDVTPERVTELIIEIIGKGQQQPSGGIPFTPRAKKVLELGLREALQMGHGYIGPEHLVCGIIREGDGVAIQVLNKLGVVPWQVRHQVIQKIAELGEQARPDVSGKAFWYDTDTRPIVAKVAQIDVFVLENEPDEEIRAAMASYNARFEELKGVAADIRRRVEARRARG